jgi:biofilm PGA synthesis N-glycosyltransferase PgaC
MAAAAVLFWLAFAGVVYIYAGYPLLVWLLARTRPVRGTPATSNAQISVVVVGYNEGARLRAKLDSIFASNSANRIAEVLVGSDGSTDDTAAVISSYPDPRVRLIHCPDRRGKPAVLNDVVPQCRAETVILTDARQMLDPAGIGLLADRLHEDGVGVVSGELMFRWSDGDTAAARGMGAYWTYEKLIRKAESRWRGVPGATGAFYALRKSLFRSIPENTLLDDVVIPMQAVEQGARCLLEAGAVAWDTPSQSTQQETVRKRRTIAGAAQLVINQPRWLLPWRNPIWWEFVSHKLLRLVSPLLLVIVLVTNLVLVESPLYQVLLAGQGLFYSLALVGGGLQALGRRASPLGPVLMFVSLNLTTLAALWDASRGRFRAAWQRTA